MFGESLERTLPSQAVLQRGDTENKCCRIQDQTECIRATNLAWSIYYKPPQAAEVMTFDSLSFPQEKHLMKQLV